MTSRITVVIAAMLIVALSAAASSAVIYVKWDSPGPDLDGLSWATAFHKVQDGLDAAEPNDEVWVAGDSAHPYLERITLKLGVALYGGFVGTEMALHQRNWAANVTILDGSQGGTVVISPIGATTATCIDGFTICNGKAGSDGYGGGIYCQSSSPTIVNNIITGNGAGVGGGICCRDSSPVITSNRIVANGPCAGGNGIYCSGGTPTICSNLVSENHGGGAFGGGICLEGDSSAVVRNNRITKNYAFKGGGIKVGHGSSQVTDNLIVDNESYDLAGGILVSTVFPDDHVFIARNVIVGNTSLAGSGGGIYCGGMNAGNITVEGNTIAANRAPGGGAGILCASGSPRILGNVIKGNAWSSGITCGSSSPTITGNSIIGNANAGLYINGASPVASNNLMAYNAITEVYKTGSGAEVLSHNCVYNPSGNNYMGLPDPTGTAGNITGDPKIASRAYGNIHIQPDSPCVSAGDDTIPQADTDIDGQPRKQGDHVDIGADESDGSIWPEGPYVAVRVAPTGNDDNDGSSWTLAKQTVQAGMYAACLQGGEVWVQQGVYYEDLHLPPYAYAYGGFAGTESARAERNWTRNESTLDGEKTSRPDQFGVRIDAGYEVSTLDGFTVTNYYNAGIRVSHSAPTVSNNVICNNHTGGSFEGGGIECLASAPMIVGNTICGNRSSYGGGIYCSESYPDIVSNRVTGNESSKGAAIYLTNCTALLAGNLIAYNTQSYWSTGDRAAVACDSCSLNIVGNTIVDNRIVAERGWAVRTVDSDCTLSDNLIAFNTAGVSSTGTSVPNFDHNCVYNPGGTNYSGVTDPTGTDGNISADPLFVNRSIGDYHLATLSPCVNVGGNDAPDLPLLDLDGEGRVYGGVVDIGADEFWPLGTIASAKLVANGRGADIDGAIVSGAFADFFYIESDDRHCGIRVNRAGHSLQAGMRVHTIGTMNTSPDGERCIDASDAHQGTPPNDVGSVDPLGMNSRALGGRDWHYDEPSGAGQRGVLGGYGVNNIGLLVRVWGSVTQIGADYLYLDDGSNLTDGTLTEMTANVGVRIICDPMGYSTGEKIEVTGISSCFQTPSAQIVRRILTRGPEDVREIGP